MELRGLVPAQKPGNGPVNFYALDGAAAPGSSDAWAVGAFRLTSQSSIEPLTEHWNGTKWKIVPNPSMTDGTCLASITAVPHSSERWAAGTAPGVHDNEAIAWLWDAAQWSQMIVPAPKKGGGALLSSITAVSHGDVWAVGTAADQLHNPHGFVDHWNGSSWTKISVNIAEPFSAFYGVGGLSQSDVWLVGAQGSTSQGFFDNVLLEHWNGAAWRAISIPAPPGENPVLQSVSALNANNVWAVGSYLVQQGQNLVGQSLIEHWNGSAWTVVPSPAGVLSSVSAFPRNVWSVGSTDGNAGTLTVLSRC